MKRDNIEVGETYLIRASITGKEENGNMLSAVTFHEGENLQVHPSEVVTSLAMHRLLERYFRQLRKSTIAMAVIILVLLIALIVSLATRTPATATAPEPDPEPEAERIETITTEAVKAFSLGQEVKIAEPITLEETTEELRLSCIDYTDEDLDWLQKCVQAEQSDFSYRASYLTASCIINRALTRNMTITEVIFEPGAFAVVSNGWIYDAEPSGQTIGACFDALACPEEWCLAFSSGHLHDSWADPIEEIKTPWETVEVFYTYDH